MQSEMYVPSVIVIINKAILRGHLGYLGMRKGKVRVVTWKFSKKLMANDAQGPLLARA
jgi:hypothetical protein